jgi:ABC-type antimicrobial peptide transport system permease subunit
MLVQTTTSDSTTMISIVLLLSAVTVVACLIPSFRASRLDPCAILRRE